MTAAEEDYIKGIYHLGKEGNTPISTNAIAAKMDTKPSSVTDMIIKLADKNLVDYKKYKGVSLTEVGRLCALAVIRRQRLWEVFLADTLELDAEEIHPLAAQLKHIKSDALILKLDAYLGSPRIGFKGAAIPYAHGGFKRLVKKLLSELPVNTTGVCIGLKDTSTAFLNVLEKKGIAVGDTIIVVEREEYDGSVKIEINTKEIQLSDQIAANLVLEVSDTED